MSDLSDEQLQKIQEYAQSFREEFEAAKDTPEAHQVSDPHKAEVDLILELDGLLPDALSAIRHVLKHSQSLNLKASTAKWLIDRKLDTLIAADKSDPLAKLLSEFQGAKD